MSEVFTMKMREHHTHRYICMYDSIVYAVWLDENKKVEKKTRLFASFYYFFGCCFPSFSLVSMPSGTPIFTAQGALVLFTRNNV